MPEPTTAPFEALILEIETATPGTYAKLCGVKDFSISRNAEIDRVEVPADCDDESLPYSIEKQVRALNYTVSGNAVWAAENHQILQDWFRSSAVKNIRVGHANAASGDIEWEQGPAILTQLDNARTKGQKITADISIEFDGTPSVVLAA